MPRLSVNVNKIATVRNSRGGWVPSVIDAVRVCLEAGVKGITVHPRADERHIRRTDVYDIAQCLEGHRPPGPRGVGDGGVEYNIEGDPRPDLLAMVRDVRADQCTLVPVRPGEITSQAGWPRDTPAGEMRAVIDDLQSRGVRVSLFIDPDPAAVRWAASMRARRIELYTEPFARAFKESAAAREQSFGQYVECAELAHALGLGINAGHDLDLQNLVLFRRLPHLAEVSIGHALVSHALFVGLARSVRDYLDVLAGAAPAAV